MSESDTQLRQISKEEFAVISNQVDLPQFLTNKIDRYFEDVFKNKWGGECILKGPYLENDTSVMINANDYLALGKIKELREAQKLGIDLYGNDQMMSSLFLGSGSAQSHFETKLATFMGVSEVLTYQSGYCANLGLFQSIIDKNVPIYIDMLTHMSIWEGARRSDGVIVPFLHNSVKHLTRKIRENGSGVIVVDSIYSTNGDICPLTEIAQVAKENGCALVVDESHSLGLYGPHGEGLVYELGLLDKVDFITASLAKAFCGRAGIVTCASALTKRFLYTNSLPIIFSSALTGYDVAGFIKSIDLIKDSDYRRSKLFHYSMVIKNELRKMGFFISDGNAPIIALQAGSEVKLRTVRDFFNKHNIFGASFAPPATTSKTSCYRLTLHSALTPQEVEKIIDVSAMLKKEYQEEIPALFIP